MHKRNLARRNGGVAHSHDPPGASDTEVFRALSPEDRLVSIRALASYAIVTAARRGCNVTHLDHVLMEEEDGR